MSKSLLYVCLFFSFLTVGCKAVKPYKDFPEFSEKTYRDYVLYRCLEKGLNEKAFSNDLSLSLYEDFTEGSISNGEIAHYLDSLVAKQVKSIFNPQVAPQLQGDVAPGSEGRNVIFMSCIYYYNSKELHNDIQKVMKMKKVYDKKLSETFKTAVGKKKPLPIF